MLQRFAVTLDVFQMKIKLILFSFVILTIFIYVNGNEHIEERKDGEELFRRLFKVRRAEQLAAVKGLQVLDDEEKKKKMISLMTEKIFAVILKSKEILENSGFVPGISNFPDEEKIRDALSNILENTAMLGDIILYLPDQSQPVIQKNPNWRVLLGWSLMFVNQTQLIDANTYKLIDLVCQEMNYTEKRPDYFNRYRKINKEKLKPKIENKNFEERKKKKKLPRGPRLSSQQFGDL